MIDASSVRPIVERLKGPIAVFGAGGFIGANLVRAILAVRDDCVAITHQRYVPWRLVELPVRHIVRADITDPESVGGICRLRAFSTIFDFAAFGGYERQDDPGLIYRTNFLGLLNILEAASDTGFSALVHAGSSSEYGLNCRVPKETSTLLPNSHYAVSKVSASYLLRYFGRVKMQPVINLRYYSVYGPFEEPDRLIPRLVEFGSRGSFPPLVDPDISRDFVYVDDAVEAALLAATIGVNRKPGASVNIATGKRTTIRDLARTLKSLCAIPGEPAWGTMPNRSWDLENWYGDPRFAREVLGWKPRTTLKRGLQETIRWQRSRQQPTPTTVLSPSGKPPRISAVIACYRDGQAIPIMHRRLTEVFTRAGVDYEIIFVNDASPDNSDEILAQISAADNHVIAIEHSRNFGSQSAFLSGMQIATGEAVVLLDGDLQDPPEIIAKFYEKWRSGYEVVYGRRIKRDTRPILRACYKAFYKIFRQMSYVPMPLDAGDFSLIDRKVVNEILALPETDQFLRGLRAWVGFSQTGVDYTRPERMFGRTTNSWRKNLWWAKKGIFSFSFVPLELLSYFGVALTGISFLAVIAQIIAKILFPETPHGITTIIVLILFFGGVQVMAISILGEYLMKIFEETKKRPKFIRKAVRFGGKHLRTADEISDFCDRRKQ
jgi:dolichol-phosphate mannosyltransferase